MAKIWHGTSYADVKSICRHGWQDWKENPTWTASVPNWNYFYSDASPEGKDLLEDYNGDTEALHNHFIGRAFDHARLRSAMQNVQNDGRMAVLEYEVDADRIYPDTSVPGASDSCVQVASEYLNSLGKPTLYLSHDYMPGLRVLELASYIGRRHLDQQSIMDFDETLEWFIDQLGPTDIVEAYEQYRDTINWVSAPEITDVWWKLYHGK